MQETQETEVRSLGQEAPLEKGMATHSSSLAWKIPRTEESSGLQSVGSQRVRHNWILGHASSSEAQEEWWGPCLQGRGPVRRSRVQESWGCSFIFISQPLELKFKSLFRNIPPTSFPLADTWWGESLGSLVGRRLALEAFVMKSQALDVLFRTGYQSMPDTHPSSAGPPAWASAVLEANQQLVMFISAVTPFWLVPDTDVDAVQQDPRRKLGTRRHHLQIILTRCCFLFPRKSITVWPSIWNSNQLITGSVENADKMLISDLPREIQLWIDYLQEPLQKIYIGIENISYTT